MSVSLTQAFGAVPREVLFLLSPKTQDIHTIKQDYLEDSYLNTSAELGTGWENWQELELPNEAEEQPVIDRKNAELTDFTNPSTQHLYSASSLPN